VALEGSLAPDITERIPVAFSGNPASGVPNPPKLVLKDTPWDVGIGDQAFLLAASKDTPYRRESADVSKQQLDTSKEPGEQTLNQWWMRSQNSWHRGAGINFYEPGSDEGVTQHRFTQGIGVDVWTEGQLSLLHKMDGVTGQAAGAAGASATTAASATAAVSGLPDRTGQPGTVFVAVLVHRNLVSTLKAGVQTNYAHSFQNVTNAVAVGDTVYFGHDQGVAQFNAATGSLTNLWTQAVGTAPVLGFAKSRLIAAIGPKLFELSRAGGALGTQTAYFTHLDPNYRWTAFCDSPTAILACGHSGGLGQVYRLTLGTSSDGATPKLEYPEQIAELPPGETMHAIHNYLGNYVALGTAKGIRIGQFSEYYNTFTYGPLSVETASPVRALTARDRYCYAAVTNEILGMSGVVRLDLSQQVAENRYAWSYDVQTHANGTASSIAFVDDRLVVGLDSWGHYLQNATEYEERGWVTSGKIRYGTSEDKSFRLARVRAQTNSGTVTLYAISESGERNVLALTDATNRRDDIDISGSIAPQEYAQFRLQLEPSVGRLGTPVVEALSIKALPAVRRQRLIQFPLMCFDRESDRWNTQHGYEGAAAERLAALEQMEETQTVVVVQDFTNGESFTGSIEKVQFSRETSPQRRKQNFGGVLLVTVRKLL
jgi:hypothetical protein